MKIEYHPFTISDVTEAFQYYESKQEGLGERFRNEVYRTLERIQSNPYLYPEDHQIRHAIVKKFPYSIVFKITNNQTIRILVIRHFKRHPEQGSTRT